MFLMQDAVSTCSATMTLLLAFAGIAEQAGLVHAALREVDRARAGRRISRAAHRLPGFFRGVDVRDQDAVGAEVERLLDAGAIVVAGYANHRFRAAVARSRKHRGELLVVHGAVLGIDQQPVVAAVRELFGDGGTVGVEEQAHLGRPWRSCFLKSAPDTAASDMEVSWMRWILLPQECT